MKKLLNLRIVSLIILSFLAACSSTTRIRSSDPDARIYVDGEFRGVGEVVHSDAKTSGSTTSVRVEKENCEPMNFSFKRNEKVDILACVAGVLIVPLFWVKKYNPERTFEFQCKKN